MKPLHSLTLLTLVLNALAATYERTSNLVGDSLLEAFYFQTIADPTHGDVNYVSESMARELGLVSVGTDNHVTLRADNTTVLTGTGKGRNSFNLKSYNQYMKHVAIFDVKHMPEGCGTWPAIFGPDWPNRGEVDIVEGVNNVSPNTVTLHTSANCTMSATRPMTGTSLGENCDVWETGNAGCGVSVPNNNSYGPDFNKKGGGWYAIERSETEFKIWFWERSSQTVPCDVSQPGDSVDTSNWGEAAANFPSTHCDFTTHFGSHNIVIDLTFCGDWAGNYYVYKDSGCPSTCSDYVNANPGAFTNAYFEFVGINIYE